MTSATFFSPSYVGDLERMVWLRRSIEAFHLPPTRHIIAVPKRDLRAFKNTFGSSDELELVCQEDFVDPAFYPDWLYRLTRTIAPNQAWRLHSRAGKGGWIIQQIVKLACTSIVKQGAIVFLDSDIFFYRPFSLHNDLGIRAGEKILVRILPEEEGAKHRHHINNARRFFDLPDGPTDTTYMGFPAIWHTDWLEKMLHHIEQLKGKPWQAALLEVDFPISEYTLYGVFIDEILKPAQLTIRDQPFNLIAWDRPSFDALKSDILHGRPLPADRLALCIQSNINIPTLEYEDMLRAILRQPTMGHGV
ncbi:MAG: DUF6492 family protein [Sulfuriferula sp.]